MTDTSTLQQLAGLLGSSSDPSFLLVKTLGSAIGLDIRAFILICAACFTLYTYSCPKVLDYVYNRTMCHLDIDGADWTYEPVMELIAKQFENKHCRVLTLKTTLLARDVDTVPQWTTEYSPRFGEHWIRYNGYWIYVARSRLEQLDRASERLRKDDRWSETLRISYSIFRMSLSGFFTVNTDTLKGFVQDAVRQYAPPKLAGTVATFQANDSCTAWEFGKQKRARNLKTVGTNKDTKNTVKDDMQGFISSREWYETRGLSYRRGWLFKGPTGTGKSSLAGALAGHLKMDIYLLCLNSNNMTDQGIAKLFASLPNRCIVLLEDIDAIGLPSRDLDGTRGSISKKNEDCKGSGRPRSQISLADLFNAIDGLVATEGRLLIATSNCPERLDETLTRPGRFDMVVPFTLATIESAADMFKRLYHGCSQPATEDQAQEFGKICGSERVCPAAIQNFITRHKNSPMKAIKDATTWVAEVCEAMPQIVSSRRMRGGGQSSG